MTTVRKAATDLRVGDYFWINRELRRVTDVDALYVDGKVIRADTSYSLRGGRIVEVES